MTPTLFLDVDGVLNTSIGSLDADKLDLVAEIVGETGAVIVISSNWRKWPEKLPQLLQALSDRDLVVAGQTPVIEVQEGLLWHANRGVEIASWLEANPGHSPIAVLDDMDIPTLRPYQIQTRFEEGLTPAQARDTVRLLQRL